MNPPESTDFESYGTAGATVLWTRSPEVRAARKAMFGRCASVPLRLVTAPMKHPETSNAFRGVGLPIQTCEHLLLTLSFRVSECVCVSRDSVPREFYGESLR